MALSVNHNLAALRAVRELHKSNDAQSLSQERLASGERITRSHHAPSTLALSERMRSQSGSLEHALRNAQASASMLQTAEASLQEVNTMLISLRQLAVQAANEGIHDELNLRLLQAEVANLLDSIDRIAANTRFGTRELLSGRHSAQGVVEGTGVEFLSASDETQSSPATGYAVQITQAPTRTQVQGQRPLQLEDLFTPEGRLRPDFRIALTEQGRTVEFSAANTRDAQALAPFASQVAHGSLAAGSRGQLEAQLQQIVAAHLRARAAEHGLELDVALETPAGTPGALLTVRHREYGSAPAFSVLSTAAGVLAGEQDRFRQALSGQDVQGLLDGQRGAGQGQVLRSLGEGEAAGIQLRADPQILAQLGGQASVRLHINQDSLHFQIGPHTENMQRVSMPDIHTQALAHNVPTENGFTSLRELDLTLPEGPQDAMRMIDQALEDITSTRVELGGLQENLLENASQSMRIWREQVISAESGLRDTDVAEEASALVSAQVKAQAGTSVLAQANQTPRSVLRLLGIEG